MATRRMVVLGGLGAAGALVVGYALWPGTRIARVLPDQIRRLGDDGVEVLGDLGLRDQVLLQIINSVSPRVGHRLRNREWMEALVL